MNNLDHTQTTDDKVAPNNESLRISVDSSAAMISPAGAGNLNEDDNLWKWILEMPWEEFEPEDLNFLTLEKPPEFYNNDNCQLPSEFGHHANQKLPREQYINPNEANFNMLPPENAGFNGEAAVGIGALGKAPMEDDITIINQQVVGENNRKRKGIEVNDNYENNAPVMRRGAPRTSKAFDYHAHPGKKSHYSINDKLMALHELIPGSQKVPSSEIADMATTLGETVEYLAQAKIREHLLQEEIKQLREAMGMIMMHSSVHKRMHSPTGTPSNMGVNPRMTMFNSSMSARMNKPSFLEQNSAAVASSLFLPPQIPAPSQQQRALQDKVLHNELFVLNEVVMKDVNTRESFFSTGDTKLLDKKSTDKQEFTDGEHSEYRVVWEQ